MEYKKCPICGAKAMTTQHGEEYVVVECGGSRKCQLSGYPLPSDLWNAFPRTTEELPCTTAKK